MSNQLNHFTLQFADKVDVLLQQRGSKLRSLVEIMDCKGEQASPVDQIGVFEADEVTTAGGAMTLTDPGVDRRWCVPTDYDKAIRFDTFEQLRIGMTDPKSKYALGMTYALGRKIDLNIFSAMFGTAKTGKQGGTNTTFGATLTTSGGQNVAVATGAAGATALTVAKLREGKRQLVANECDMDNDELICATSSKDEDSLLAEAQVISTDFNNEGERPVLKEGRVTRFLGINFGHYEGIATQTATDDAAGTSRQVPLFMRSGMTLGIWGDVTIDINQRTDLRSLPWQVYGKVTVGATRNEEKKVARIWSR